MQKVGQFRVFAQDPDQHAAQVAPVAIDQHAGGQRMACAESLGKRGVRVEDGQVMDHRHAPRNGGLRGPL